MPSLLRKILMLFMLVLSFNAWGTTVVRKTTGQLLDEARLIIEGQVIASASQFEDSGAIFTYIEVLILDAIKGNAVAGDTVVLQFVGGQVGDTVFDIGVQYPQPGEKGIYFLHDPVQVQLSPLVGWTQGHFIIDASGAIVTAQHLPVTGFDRIEATDDDFGISNGVAVGVTVTPDLISTRGSNYSVEALSTPGLTVQVFKSLVVDGLGQ